MLQPAPQAERATPPRAPISSRPRLRRRRTWLAVGTALAVALGGFSLWSGRRTALQRQNLSAYTVVAERGSLPGIVTANGELAAVRSVNVSPKRQGLLQELYVEEGDQVRRGQPIALMDSGDLKDRLMELEAQLLSAQSQANRSRSELERNISLYKQNAISLNDINRFRSAEQVDRQAVNAARQRLEQRRVERSELTLRAPFDGVITARYADPGAFVTPTTAASATAGATSSSVVELAEGLEVVAKVPENEIGRIQVGQIASVRVESFPDRRFSAQVKQIAPRAVKTNNVTSFEVKLRLIDPPPELRIGMSADIDFQTGQLESRTLVPTVAVVTEQGKPGVLLVGKNNEPTFRTVTLGATSGRNTQILSGLESGTRVFIDLPPWAKKRGSGESSS